VAGAIAPCGQGDFARASLPGGMRASHARILDLPIASCVTGPVKMWDRIGALMKDDPPPAGGIPTRMWCSKEGVHRIARRKVDVFWMDESPGVVRGWYWEALPEIGIPNIDDPAPQGPFVTSAAAWLNAKFAEGGKQ
jgi:hypothetical protein